MKMTTIIISRIALSTGTTQSHKGGESIILISGSIQAVLGKAVLDKVVLDKVVLDKVELRVTRQ